MRRLFLALALTVGAGSASAQGPRPIDINTGFEGVAMGVCALGAVACDGSGVGAAWVDHTAADFDDVTAAAPSAGQYLVGLTVINTHGGQTLYLLLQAGGATSTAEAIAIAPGASLTLTGLLGMSVQTISVQGSGAATTGSLIAYWR